MKNLLGGIAISALLAAPAFAADLPARMPVKAPPPVVAAVYNWTGFYIGGHVGYAWGRSRTDVGLPDALDCGGGASCESFSHKVDGVFGGGHIGYNWQVNSIVFGLEAEGGYLGAKGTAFSTIAPDHRFETKYGGYGAFTGRLGVAVDRTLFYGKGGFVIARIKNEALDDFPTPDVEHIGRSNKTRFGWTAGGGIEYAFANNWSVRGEYLYMRFNNKTVFDLGDGSGGVPPATDPSPYTFHDHLHTVRFALSYKFGGPVVARY
jgi:outer membrane immunogenic protein